jgi:PilZ domain-containing protein
MTPPENTRDSERVEILGELKGEVTILQPMAIRELSRGGAQIEINVPLHVDSLHEFRLTLGDRSVVVKGRVVHCSIVDVEHELVLYKAGIEFVEPADRVSAVVSEFIDAIQAGRRSA